MKISNISVPDVYVRESADFRFFLKWFETALTKIQHDIENIFDLYDPLKCPDWLLWMLCDTMGFKYDDRLPTAFNRLVLIYFMSMIRNKGSKDGVTLAAEVNLAQFNILKYGQEKDILYNRLEDTSIPVNSVYVNPHVDKGYIDVVYFSERVPIDACIEYVRPIGLYLSQSAGVRFDARTKISVDPRLCGSPNDLNVSIGPTHVGHYSREDYARMQKIEDEDEELFFATKDPRYEYTQSEYEEGMSKRAKYQEYISEHQPTYIHTREGVFYRNSEYEEEPTPNVSSEEINPGLRALYSLQLCNNEHIVQSLLPNKIFGIGYGPMEPVIMGPEGSEYTIYCHADTTLDEDGRLPDEADSPMSWNLRYDYTEERATGDDVYTMDKISDKGKPYMKPSVNAVMSVVGEAVASDGNSNYSIYHPDTDTYETHEVDPRGEIGDSRVEP